MTTWNGKQIFPGIHHLFSGRLSGGFFIFSLHYSVKQFRWIPSQAENDKHNCPSRESKNLNVIDLPEPFPLVLQSTLGDH